MAAKKKRPKPDPGKTVRRIARNVVGSPKPARAIQPESKRKKPKHKKELLADPE